MQVLDDLRVADVVREHAVSRSDVVAIRCGARALTYAELDDRSSRLAQALLSAGVSAGDRVAHLDRTAPEILELLFATSKIGAVTVPLNWRLAPAELETIVADAGCTVMIAGPSYREAAREIAGDVPQPLAVIDTGEEYEHWLASHAASDPGHRGERRARSRCRCTRRGRPACPRASSRPSATSPPRISAPSCGCSIRDSVSLTPLPMFHIGGIGWAYLGLVTGATTILVSEFDAARRSSICSSANG